MSRQLLDRRATRGETFMLLNRESREIQNYDGKYVPNPHHCEMRAGDWFEICEDEYHYFLGVLPPLAMVTDGYSMSEFQRDDLTNSFHRLFGRYFCTTIRSAESSAGAYRDLVAGRKALRQALDAFDAAKALGE